MPEKPSKWKPLDPETRETVLATYNRMLVEDVIGDVPITEDMRAMVRVQRAAILANDIELQGDLGILMLKRDCLHLVT